MKFRSLVALVGVAFIATALSGCGGGGDSSAADPLDGTTTARAEGVYRGGLNGSASKNFQLLVLENDEFWSLYGDDTASQFLVRGFLQGTGTSNNGSFTGDARDFGAAPPASAPVVASYRPHGRVIGTVASPEGVVFFVGDGVDGTNSTYDYDKPASLGDISGSWSLNGLDGTATDLTVGASGVIQASTSACTLSGTIAPRPSGKNVFDVSVTMGVAPCSSPGTTFRGVALSYLLPATSTRQLIVGVVDSNRTSGAALFGTR